MTWGIFWQAISGSISRTVTNPLERLKVLKQVSVGEYKGLSTAQSFMYMWRNEGVYGFFKGNGVNIVRIAPFSAFEFYFYEVYKSKLFGDAQVSNSAKLICGGLTGMTASTLTYPLDLIRTKLSINVADSTIKPSIWGTGKQIVRESGFTGLYKGLPSTLFVSQTGRSFKDTSMSGLQSLMRSPDSNAFRFFVFL